MGKFFKYIFFGSLGTLVDTTVFILLTINGIKPITANILSVSLGILLSYFLNSRLTFAKGAYTIRQVLRFIIVGLSGLTIYSIAIWVILNYFEGSPYFAKFMMLPIIACYQYALNTLWTFR